MRFDCGPGLEQVESVHRSCGGRQSGMSDQVEKAESLRARVDDCSEILFLFIPRETRC